MSPFIRIYTAQYARRLTDKDGLIIGGGHANIKYDDGQSHAPTFIIGYRRYIWKKAHAECQLWPLDFLDHAEIRHCHMLASGVHRRRNSGLHEGGIAGALA